MTPLYVVDIIGEVVAAVTTEVLSTIQANETAALGTTLIETIDYQYGHVKELIQTLQQMDKDAAGRFQKYPCVYLVQDFTEKKGAEVGIYAQTSLSIILMHSTVQSYKITDRYAKVFKPVLYPIYVSLLKQLSYHDLIMQGDDEAIVHDKTDRSYWGTSANKNSLTDFVDAIEINNLSLNISFQNC